MVEGFVGLGRVARMQTGCETPKIQTLVEENGMGQFVDEMTGLTAPGDNTAQRGAAAMTRRTSTRSVDRWWVPVVAIVAVLLILLFLASLVVAYWGDEYGSPPWDEKSVPAPRTY
jgi:uncharacterized membrane protein YdfJ with MMPL/SSD domain